MKLGQIIETKSPEVQGLFHKAFILAEDTGDTKGLTEVLEAHFKDVEAYETFKQDVLEQCQKETDENKTTKEKLMKNKEKFQKGYSDLLENTVDIDEMADSEDYREGVKQAKLDESKPERVLERGLEKLTEMFEDKMAQLEEKIASMTPARNDEVTSADCFTLGLNEGRRGNADAELDTDIESLEEAFTAGLGEGLKIFNEETSAIRFKADRLGVSIEEALVAIANGAGQEALEPVIEALNEAEGESVDLIEGMVEFANRNGLDILIEKKKSCEDEEDEEDDEDEGKKKEDEEDDEDEEKEVPEDIKEAIEHAKQGMTQSEQISLDERIAEIEFEDTDELREALTELLNSLTEEDDASPEEDAKKTLINRYK